jgi:drug/metabolite transporter (DMT)-like permease
MSRQPHAIQSLPRLSALPVPARSLFASPGALAVLSLVGANVIWGGSAAASKAALSGMPPMTLASGRVAIALLVLLVLVHRRGERPATGAMPAALGLTGVALFCACQNYGLLFADATTTALIGGTIPVLTAALAVPLLGERLGAIRMCGLVMSLAGVCMITLLGAGTGFGMAAAGNLLPIASAIAFALYAVLGRRAFGQGSAIPLVAGSTRYGLLWLMPLTVWELATRGPGSVGITGGLLLAYLGAGCSALAFILCGYGLAHLDAGASAIYGNLKPLVGVALAVTLLGEPLSGSLVGGGMMVLLGVSVSTSGARSQEWVFRTVTRATARLAVLAHP